MSVNEDAPEFAAPKLTVQVVDHWIVRFPELESEWSVIANHSDQAVIEAWYLQRGLRRRDGTPPPKDVVVEVNLHPNW
jgi:hypothetical protein